MKVTSPKQCIKCGIFYIKDPHNDHEQWEKSKFCSRKCVVDSNPTLHGYWTGKKRPNLKLPQHWKSGSQHPYWKGGVSRLNEKSRSSYKYATWRKIVLDRDKICIWCGNNTQLQVDHIKSFRDFPELRFDPQNGRVLCFPCHKKTVSYGFFPKKEGFYA